MVIPLIMRGAGMAARGMGAGIKGAGRGIKNRAQQGFQSWKDKRQKQKSDDLELEIWRREQQERQGVQIGAVAAGGAAGGLMGGLAGSGLRGLKKEHEIAKESISKKSVLILLLPIALTIWDYFYGINGIPLDSIFAGGFGDASETIFRILASAAYWASVIIYWIIRKPESRGEWAYPLVLFLLGFFILVYSGNGWTLYHSAFAVITFAYLLDGFNEDVKISGAHWVFLIVLFMDIFGLATINKLYPEIIFNPNVQGQFISGSINTDFFLNRLLFPFWFFFYLFFVKPGKAKTAVSIFLVLFYTGYGLTSIIVPAQVIPVEDLRQQQEEAKNAVVKAIDNWRDQIASWLAGRLEYAVTGKVEKNQYEPLGVSLENVQPADPKYYEDEDVIVWGTVKARTLDDPINLKVGCFVKPDIEKIYSDETDPDKKFLVFTLEEQDFACTFTKGYNKKNDILNPGRNTIKAFADFNFETLAYLKVYFMNRERQRAMVREGLDPFDEFAITDRNPVAVYTNGPAKIEMGTNNPLISVSEDYVVEPSLDIKIDNREGWQGRINRLKELVLFLPEGVQMDAALSCNKKFVNYSIGSCRASCTEFVEKECTEVCNGFTDVGEKNRCDDECTKRKGVCEESCGSFFAEGGQSYKGYALDVKDIKYRDEETDFEKGKLFRCRFRPTESVLGASPFTIKSFRVKARYDYSLEEDVSVEIVGIPKEEKLHVGPPRELRGRVENVKEDEGKIAGDIIIEWKRSVNDGSGANDVIGYRVYRKQKLEDKWNRIAGFNSGTSTFDEGGDTWYRHIDHVEFPADFKYYYHAEAIDEDGNWEKSLQMLEILPGPIGEEPKASLLDRPKEEGESA